MALSSEQLLIAEVIGYEPVTDDEGTQQYPADVDFQDAPKGAIPCTGNVYKNKKGVLRCYWIPAGGNYSSEEQDELTGWYDVPDLEDIEEFTFDSCCPTPAGDDVEPDHPDSLAKYSWSYLIKPWAITYLCDVSPRINLSLYLPCLKTTLQN
jgi:hypothetical protein